MSGAYQLARWRRGTVRAMSERWKGGLSDDVGEVLFDEATIAKRVAELGAEIEAAYQGRDLLVVGILKGSFPFLADLVRCINLPLTVDFMALSSYRGTKSTGVVKIMKDLDRSIVGKDVLVVEDIVDTGLTLRYLLENLETRQPASTSICTLLDKTIARKEDVEVRYSGFECPDAFVVGYGLDYDGVYRNLPYIGVLEPAVYQKE
jgi:hypoxanthine phosphoribosyltransferase